MFSDVIILILCLTETFSLSFAGESREQTNLLGRAVQSALGFNSQNVPRGRVPVVDEREEGTRYMMHLYKNFRHGLSPKGLDTNTVRSIQASIGKVDGEEVFLFNMSAVATRAHVLKADVHFFKRKHRRDNLHMLLLEVAPTYATNLTDIDLKTPSYGWQANDATESVRSCLAAKRSQPHLLAIRFVKDQKEKNGEQIAIKIPVKKFMFHHSKPFLVVYANETQNISLDHLKTYFKASDQEKQMANHASKNSKWYRKQAKTPGNLLNGVRHKLFRRSIYDNEIPQDPSTSVYTYQKSGGPFNIPHTHPSILQGRQKPKRKPDNTQYIPYPKQYRRSRRKNRKNRRKNRRRNRNRDLPPADQWKDWVNSQNLPDDEEKVKSWSCGKKKLVLDFADIGWNDWIIAPGSFEANYCSGNCTFPLQKESRPSNHATIQSIVHAVGLKKAVPEPCCVPDVLSSVTLLYVGDDGTIVLKNYPSMTVESCGCR